MILSMGVDSLVVGYCIKEYSVDSWEVLAEAKQAAAEKHFAGSGMGVEWYFKSFVVLPRGTRGYEWILENADVRVQIAKRPQGGRVFPEVYVTFRAAYLWSEGFIQAEKAFREWLETWAVVCGDVVSRVDLCQDQQLALPDIDLSREVVTRARSKGEFTAGKYYSGRHTTGYKIGSGALQARIYAKLPEVRISHKEWFFDIWKAGGWDGHSDITRIEFQFRRDFLHEMKIGGMTDLVKKLASLWNYCTTEWLRVVDRGAERHQTRWRLKPFWKLVQEGRHFFGEAVKVVREKVKRCSMKALVAQGQGCFASIAALMASEKGVEYGLQVTRREIMALLHGDGFRSIVEARLPKFKNLSAPDTRLVDLAIQMGGRVASAS